MITNESELMTRIDGALAAIQTPTQALAGNIMATREAIQAGELDMAMTFLSRVAVNIDQMRDAANGMSGLLS